MSVYLDMLKRKYLISEERFLKILNHIISIETNMATPVNEPSVIILGAQPGAGKTELQKEAEIRLLKNAVICNADNFRNYHPLSKEIRQNYPDEYSEITAGYAQRWNIELCKYCREHKLNYILETTFRSDIVLNHTLTELKNNGYRTEIMILAVDPRISRLGISQRYEDMVKNAGAGRKVSIKDHDVRFNAIQNTISKTQGHLVDNFFIYARTIVIQNAQNTDGVTLVAENPVNPLVAYTTELKRVWPEKAVKDFERRCNKVLTMMQERGASKIEVEAFKTNVILETSPKKAIRKGRRI